MSAPAKPRILMVDDEPNILAGYRRLLSSRYDVTAAGAGREGLALIPGASFAVIVSDMRMPEMDGIQFLQAARAIDADAVLLMLSGNADQETAVRAVNEGAIFRFLNKPCPPDTLERALQDALRQHELVTAERTLLRDTLAGSLKLLVDALTLHDPRTAQALRAVRATAAEIAGELGVGDDWRIGMAGTLCLVGLLTMPDVQSALDLPEPRLVECAARGAKLLRHVPRLEPVAEMIEHQRDPGPCPASPALASSPSRVVLGSRIVRFAFDLERATHLLAQDRAAALLRLRYADTDHDQRLFEAAERILHAKDPAAAALLRPVNVRATGLQPGMTAAQDVVSIDGKLMLARGYELTELVIENLQSLAHHGLIGPTVSVILAPDPAHALSTAAAA